MDGEFFYILQMAANFKHEHPLTFRIVSAGIPLIDRLPSNKFPGTFKLNSYMITLQLIGLQHPFVL